MAPSKFGFGQSVTRKEDDPLLRGAGRYIADAVPEGALRAVLVRSPHAHARFRLDAERARAMKGVRLLLTGNDIGDIGLLPMQAGIPGVDIPVPRYPPHSYHSCDRLLNFCIDVRTHMNVRNFLFLDSVLVSVDW